MPRDPAASLDDNEERAAFREFEGGATRAASERAAAAEQGFASPADLRAAAVRGWADRLARLSGDYSPYMPGEDRALACIANALRFIQDGWAEKSLALGWTELELVGAHPVAPWTRFDVMGAAYSRFAPAAVTAEGIVYREGGPSGPLRFRRGAQKDGSALPWDARGETSETHTRGRTQVRRSVDRNSKADVDRG